MCNQLEEVKLDTVFKSSIEYMKRKTGKQDTTDFTDCEKAEYNGYLAGILAGVRLAGVEVTPYNTADEYKK